MAIEIMINDAREKKGSKVCIKGLSRGKWILNLTYFENSYLTS